MFTGVPDSLLDEENCNPSSKCDYDGCAEPACQSVEYWVEQIDFNDGSEVDYYSFAEPRPDSSGDPGGSSGPSLIGTAISLAAKQAGGVYGSVASAAISAYFDQYNSSVVTLDKNNNDTYDEEEWYWDISIDSDETGKDTFPTETCASNGVQLKIDNNAIHQDVYYCIRTSSRYDIIYPAYGSNHYRCEWGGHTYTIKTTQKASNY